MASELELREAEETIARLREQLEELARVLEAAGKHLIDVQDTFLGVLRKRTPAGDGYYYESMHVDDVTALCATSELTQSTLKKLGR